MITINQTIPDFELEAFHKGEIKKIKFSDYIGKWLILLFYPADFTFVCPTELREAASFYKQFQKYKAEIISISTDSVYVHKAWHEQSDAIKEIMFPMASDRGGKVSRAFGSYIDEEGISIRATFIIDPDGVLKVLEMHDNDVGRSSSEILRKLQALDFVRKNTGQLCPASWKPGEKAIKTP